MVYITAHGIGAAALAFVIFCAVHLMTAYREENEIRLGRTLIALSVCLLAFNAFFLGVRITEYIGGK